jgi:hypothetical protein
VDQAFSNESIFCVLANKKIKTPNGEEKYNIQMCGVSEHSSSPFIVQVGSCY